MLDSIAFIGGGVMAEAMIGGLLRGKLVNPGHVVALLAQGQVGRTIGKNSFLVVLVELLHVKPVDSVAHHHIQSPVLLRVGQGDAAALFVGCGQHELLKHLMVQVRGQQEDILLVLF